MASVTSEKAKEELARWVPDWGLGGPPNPRMGRSLPRGSDTHPTAPILVLAGPPLFCLWEENWAAFLGMMERRGERRLEKQLEPSFSK